MEEKTKSILKTIGIIIVVLLVGVAWSFGFFWIIFYIFGFYAVLYFLSLAFKTTAIINTILGIGGFLLYAFMGIWMLWLLYLSLNIMFTESFFQGLLLVVIGLPIAQAILYAVGLGLGFILGYPLIWFSGDLEKRFGEKDYLLKENEYEVEGSKDKSKNSKSD
ncbi:hypothetical protein L6274_02210 [Candidatus Parcubacteria bacterium]|nr:hypothetical protein [Candidatus Parcubacteria bacterium]